MTDVVTQRVGDGWGDNSAPPKDLDDNSRRREFKYEGRTFIMQARDPHGFWHVKMPSGGKPPTYLSGQYTGLWECEKDIKQWCTQNPLSVPLVQAREAGTTPPKLKTKKRIPKKKVKADAQREQAVQQAPLLNAKTEEEQESLFKAKEEVDAPRQG